VTEVCIHTICINETHWLHLVAHIQWIASDLAQTLRAKPAHVSLDIYVHITGPPDDLALPTTEKKPKEKNIDITSSTGRESDDLEKTSKSSQLDFKIADGITEVAGRPDIGAYLEEEIVPGVESVSVDVSGPPSLGIAVSQALSGKLALVRGVDVSLHVEKFGIA